MTYVIATISGLYLGKQTLPYDAQQDLTDVYFVDELSRAHHYDTEEDAVERLLQINQVISSGICYVIDPSIKLDVNDYSCRTVMTSFGGDTDEANTGNKSSNR